MFTITIDDPNAYLGGEAFAREHHSNLKEMVNKYVASLAAKVKSPQKEEEHVPLTQTAEFKKALDYMDSFVADDINERIPENEDGKGALAGTKYGL